MRAEYDDELALLDVTIDFIHEMITAPERAKILIKKSEDWQKSDEKSLEDALQIADDLYRVAKSHLIKTNIVDSSRIYNAMIPLFKYAVAHINEENIKLKKRLAKSLYELGEGYMQYCKYEEAFTCFTDKDALLGKHIPKMNLNIVYLMYHLGSAASFGYQALKRKRVLDICSDLLDFDKVQILIHLLKGTNEIYELRLSEISLRAADALIKECKKFDSIYSIKQEDTYVYDFYEIQSLLEKDDDRRVAVLKDYDLIAKCATGGSTIHKFDLVRSVREDSLMISTFAVSVLRTLCGGKVFDTLVENYSESALTFASTISFKLATAMPWELIDKIIDYCAPKTRYQLAIAM